MNVSKINVYNTNKTGVSPFKGDTPVPINEAEKHNKSAKNFLYGAGAISAGILAIALAGRYGLFSKTVKEVAKNTPTLKNSGDVLQNNPVAPITKSKETFANVPIGGSRENRIANNTVNPELLQTNIKYAKFNIDGTPAEQSKFFHTVADKIHNMSYEEQFEEFKYLLKFLENEDSSKIKGTISIDFGVLKRDNRFRFYNEFINTKPEVREIFKSTDSQIASYFTNAFEQFRTQEKEVLAHSFGEYLKFIKLFPAEQLKNKILFIPGKFSTKENINITKQAIEFAKENPAYSETIVDNLLSYEPPREYCAWLANNGFRPGDGHEEYNRHVDNIIDIRKLLTASGLKCSEHGRMKNRLDWLGTGDKLINNFTLGFQYSHKLAHVKNAAFEYDMMNGLTRQEADEMIESITSLHETSQGSRTEQIYAMPYEEMIGKINKAVV